MMALLLIVLGYLVGSIPFAYIIVRRAKGIDLRRYGSGNVGASNVGQFLGAKGFVLVVVLDMIKGASVVLIAQILNRPELEKVLIGLATIAGHNWPLFLKFHGGRGIATIPGVLLILVPKVFPVAVPLTLLLIGVSRNGAVPVVVGLVIIPVAGFIFYGPGPLFLGCMGMSLLAFAKRLQGSPGAPPEPGVSFSRVLFYRLLYDRDIRDQDAWISRHPNDPDVRKGPAEE